MPKKRNLSAFLCRELLYDYVDGRLDESRREAVEKGLAESESVREELRALKEGLKYCKTLTMTGVTPSFLTSLSRPPRGMKDYKEAWKKVAPPVRLAIHSLGVALSLAGLALLIPKEYAPWARPTSYTLVEVKRDGVKPNVELMTTTTVQVAATDVTPATYGPPTTLKIAQENQREKSASRSFFNFFAPSSPKPDVPSAPATVATTTSAVPTLVSASPSTSTTFIAKPGAPAEATDGVKFKGEIYRVYMNTDDVDTLTPQFAEKILELGGVKAGEVQLGWRRRQGSYFHFTLPEAHFSQFKAFLQNFGPVRIVREPHVRVMPAGTIRLILWLEATKTIEDDSKTQHESE